MKKILVSFGLLLYLTSIAKCQQADYLNQLTHLQVSYNGSRLTSNGVSYPKIVEKSSFGSLPPNQKDFIQTEQSLIITTSELHLSFATPLPFYSKGDSTHLKHFLWFGIGNGRSQRTYFKATKTDNSESLNMDLRLNLFNMSLVYEYVLNPKNKFKISTRVGYNFMPQIAQTLLVTTTGASSDTSAASFYGHRFFLDKIPSHRLHLGLSFKMAISPTLSVGINNNFGFAIQPIDRYLHTGKLGGIQLNLILSL